MKRIIIALVFSLLLAGCLTKIVIPDEPKYREMLVYHVEQGIIFDQSAVDALQYNIMALKDYADKMRKMLEDQK